MQLDALVTPGTMVYGALVAFAAFGLTRSSRSPVLVDERQAREVIGEAGLDPGGCAWKVRVLALADGGDAPALVMPASAPRPQ